jgi:tetratricopeptide (TPR) repeat protein
MYEAVREFGLEQLEHRQEMTEAIDARFAYCLSISAYSDQIPTYIVPARWLRRIDRERATVRAAYQHLVHRNDASRLLQFVVAFGHYLYLRGPLDEAWEWFQHAMRVDPHPPTTLRLQALYWSSHYASHFGEIEQAFELATEARETAREIGSPGWEAAALNCLCGIEQHRGNPLAVLPLAAEELRLWQESGEIGLSGFAYKDIADAELVRGNLTEARVAIQRSAEIFREQGSLGWVALTDWYQGQIAFADGDAAAAATHYRIALQRATADLAAQLYPLPLLSLSQIASECGVHDLAAQLAGASVGCQDRRRLRPRPYVDALLDAIRRKGEVAIGAATYADLFERGKDLDHWAWLHLARQVERNAASTYLVIDKPLVLKMFQLESAASS